MYQVSTNRHLAVGFALGFVVGLLICFEVPQLLEWQKQKLEKQIYGRETRKNDNLHFPEPRTFSKLEIRIEPKALYGEGIGGTLADLRSMLILANSTGATIALKSRLKSKAHKYYLDEYLRFRAPLRSSRVFCRIPSKELSRLFGEALAQCEKWNYTNSRRVFLGCNTLRVNFIQGHPRQCTAHTAQLVRNFWRPELPNVGNQNDVCVLRRGGDVEDKIMRSNTNDFQWIIDENRTLPILSEARDRGRRIVLITQTKYESQLRSKYRPHILSNGEKLTTVVNRISKCRCLFVAGGSSFALATIQLAQPKFIVYTISRPGWKFKYPDWHIHEFGDRAFVITTPQERLIELCAPRKM